MNNTIIPKTATHPGEVLNDELKARNIKQIDFAIDINMQATMLNEILKGKRPITADIALLLEKTLDIPADFWLKYQMQYELDSARIKERNIQKLQLIEHWQLIKQYTPVKFLYKLGFISYNISEDILKIKEMYQVNNIDELIDSYTKHKFVSPKLANYRKSASLQVNEVNMFGWSKLVMWQAKEAKVKAFQSNQFPELKKELHRVFNSNSNIRVNTKRVLADYGIKLVYQEKFEKTPIDGFSFWSDENPAIGLTLRHNRIDNFAFTIFHELGHIYLHLQNDKSSEYIDLEKMDNSKTFVEKEADNFAQANLIDADKWLNFTKNGSFNDDAIIEFSKENKINPAIVLGRICFENKNYAVKTKIDRSLN